MANTGSKTLGGVATSGLSVDSPVAGEVNKGKE